MTFVLRMVWRETRASWARLLFFFLCAALGVAAIVVLRSVVQNVRITLTREARSLVGADIVLQAPRPWSDEALGRIAAGTAGVFVRARTEVVETQTMVRAAMNRNAPVKLIELRGVEAAFPFYGAIELSDGRRYTHDLVRDHGLVVHEDLLADLGLKIGDALAIAGETFVIRAAFTRDRVQQAMGLQLGPRVYLDLADLRATALLARGSRAAHEIFLRVDEPAIDATTTRLRQLLRNDVASVRSWMTLEDRLGRNLTLAENYLSLVGFAMVVLGGLGVWSVTRVLVQEKVRSVAILKCLGASARAILAIYVLQVLVMAAAASGIGVALAAVAARAIPPEVIKPLGVSSVTITASAAAQGAAVGLLVSLLFAVVPLLDMRLVKPLRLLRADVGAEATRRRDWAGWLIGTAVGALLVGVAAWQANSLRAGLYVTAGLAGVGLLLALASRIVVRLVAPLAASRQFAIRHAVLGLSRPGNQTRVILMAVGLGAFFVLTVRALQVNLLADLDEQLGSNLPDLVLVDVQPDQVSGVQAALAPHARRPPGLNPHLRARIIAVNGRRQSLEDLEAVRKVGPLAREFALTYRDVLEPSERIVAGEFWSGRQTAPEGAEGVDAEVSMAEDLRHDARLDLGDVITFDIAGRRLRARVTSLRNVAWGNEQNGGFVFVLRPSAVVDALPQNFLGFVQLKEGSTSRNAVQRAVVSAYPNVTIIDVRDIIGRLREVVDNVALGVTIVGLVTLVSGTLILIGAVAMTRFQRLYESAIYRTLGASTRRVLMLVAVEYGVLGLGAGAVGAAGAFVLSWALARFLFDLTWRPAPGLLLGGLAGTTVLVMIVGVVISLDVVIRKPLATLRGEA